MGQTWTRQHRKQQSRTHCQQDMGAATRGPIEDLPGHSPPGKNHWRGSHGEKQMKVSVMMRDLELGVTRSNDSNGEMKTAMMRVLSPF